MGAAGRDFHNFNTFFKGNPNYRVLAFTAAQISELDTTAGVEKRIYPSELAGSLYPEGIKIYSEERLEELIKEYEIDEVFFSYSDVSARYLHDEAARVQAAGASFVLLGPKDTMIKPRKHSPFWRKNIPIIRRPRSIWHQPTGSKKCSTARTLP